VTERFSGSGPGAQAPDGCSVELYRKFPYLNELEDHRALFPAGSSILELGCGAGRLTRRLLEWNVRVTAVDNSPLMLSLLPPAATRVLSDIASLRLDETFDVVLLASCLINHPAAKVRSIFAQVARRHLRKGGHLLLERHDPMWLRTVEVGPLDAIGDVAMSVEAVVRTADSVQMTLRYESAGQVWRHSFVVTPLSEADLETLLLRSGFGSWAWSGKRNRWLSAVLS
jgi:SAM-dependent methyltransferase